MQLWTTLFLIMIPALAMAAPGGHGHGLDDKTIRMMIFQCINVGILLAAMIYFLRGAVRSYFKDKQTAFLATAEKAQAAKRQAEQEYNNIKNQLTKLETTADESLSRARAEATDLRNQIIGEAKNQAEKIKKEAESAAQIAVEKARQELREQAIREATRVAKETIEQKVSSEDHKRLQGDFIQNIGTVQP